MQEINSGQVIKVIRNTLYPRFLRIALMNEIKFKLNSGVLLNDLAVLELKETIESQNIQVRGREYKTIFTVILIIKF